VTVVVKKLENRKMGLKSFAVKPAVNTSRPAIGIMAVRKKYR
jgi:hypothetical protein